jgi:Flp pilus assembly pilin Flp
MKRVRDFLKDNAGASALEYALLVSGISVAILGVVFGVGQGLDGAEGAGVS